MKELMIHVERIVRPVRATQSRKLRMRRELLGHLAAAMEEERSKTADEALALEQAKQRLGEPAELTRELQCSVPLIERVLLAKTPDKYNGWEKRANRRFGFYDPATFAHWFILHGAGAIALLIVWLFTFLPRIPSKMWMRFFLGEIDHRVHTKTVFAVIWFVQMFWVAVGMRFLSTVSDPAETFRLSRVIRNGMLVLIAQGALMFLILTQVVRRSPTVADMVQSLGVSLLLLGAVFLVGRGVAALRRPYDEWLTLDLAE